MIKGTISKMKLKISNRAILLMSVFTLVNACTNISGTTKSLTTTNPSSFIGSSTTTYTHIMKNAVPTALSDGSGNLELSLTTDTSVLGYQSLTQFCTLNSTTIPCTCKMTWNEINTVGGSSTTFERTKKAPITSAVQTGLVKCKMTSAFWNEIPDGTTVRITIASVTPNASGLNVKPLALKKGSSTTPNGDFIDDTLTPFRNIYRYTCSSRRNNTFEILNQYTPTTASSGTSPPTYNVLMASRFCSGAPSSGGASCGTPRSGFSAQSYYRNLLVRSDKLGDINSKNAYYDCPKVEESISYSAGQTIPNAEKHKYWPLDTTYALATTFSTDWSVPVRAGSILYKSGDANATNEGCNSAVDGDNTRYLNEAGVITSKCLGYAKKPKTNGTCGSITDSNGRVRPLTRLRRFRAVFPPTFDFKGQPEARSGYADEVYISDRLVVDNSGVPSGSMIYGPKPCNYSWFDHEGVTNPGNITGRYGEGGIDFKTNFRSTSGPSSIPSYVATSKYRYDDGTIQYSVSPDGRILPNFDRDGTIGGPAGPSCSAAISLIDEVMGAPSSVRIMTSNVNNAVAVTLGTRKIYMNEVHLNPIDPWTPNYIEDTSFLACAPVADPYLEPPLQVFKKDNNTMGWCAKVYPTQNPYWTDLNASKRYTSSALTAKLVNYPAASKVKGFTSHIDSDGAAVVASPSTLDQYNRCSSTGFDKICSATVGASSGASYTDCINYLTSGTSDGVAVNHTNTCDRTVSYDGTSDFRTFPLQASDADVQEMLQQDLNHDRSFSCQYSVNADQAKVNAKIPSSGCCGVINGNAVLKSLITGGSNVGGHLEPLLNGLTPTVRFCGNPVE
jgi:hypothetical protein